MKRHTPHLSPLVVFFSTMLAGLVVTTVLFRSADRETLSPPGQSHRVYTGQATDAQKLYIAARTAASELLFKVAFAAFGGLAALQLSEKSRALVSERGVFAAAGLLLTSLYASFLFQMGVSRCMEASLDDIFGAVLTVPILCQFWFLFVAIVIVAVSLFRGTRRATAAAALVIALVACRGAYATPATTAACITSWASPRRVQLPAGARRDGVARVTGMAARQQLAVAAADRCIFAETMLDAVRYTAIEDGNPVSGAEGGEALAKIIRDARRAAESPNLAPGGLMASLSSIAQIWEHTAGVIDIDAKKPLFVLVTDRRPASRGQQWAAYTRCVLRLEPGRYAVRVAEGTRVVYDAEVEVVRGGRVPIDAGPP